MWVKKLRNISTSWYLWLATDLRLYYSLCPSLQFVVIFHFYFILNLKTFLFYIYMYIYYCWIKAHCAHQYVCYSLQPKLAFICNLSVFYVIKPFAHVLVQEKATTFVENDRHSLINSVFWCCFDTIIKKIANRGVVFKHSLQKLWVLMIKVVYKDSWQR